MHGPAVVELLGEPQVTQRAAPAGGGDAYRAAVEELLRSIDDRLGRVQEARIRIGPARTNEYEWHGGLEVTYGSATYIVHDPVDLTTAPDHSWTLMQADAHRFDSGATPVRLRGLVMLAETKTTEQIAEALRTQASLLGASDRRGRLPELIGEYDDGRSRVLITSRSSASSWQQMFGDGQQPSTRS